MKAVNPYLNFPGNTEEAFTFYQTVFGGERPLGVAHPGLARASQDQARSLLALRRHGLSPMMTLMFTFLFGGALAGSPRDYIQFLLPGILIQAIIFITVYTGVGLNTDIGKGLFDRFRSLPIWSPHPSSARSWAT